MWHFEDGLLVWHVDRKGYCVDIHAHKANLETMPIPVDGPTFQTCASKPGQRFRKGDPHSDGSFQLLDDSDPTKCLCGSSGSAWTKFDSSSVRPWLCSCESWPAERWVEDRQKEQIRHAQTGNCLTAGRGQPTVSPCTDYVHARDAQRFQYIEKPGWLQKKGIWGDNGRKRWFETCLDFHAVPRTKLSIRRCQQNSAMQFEKLGARTPPEWQMWQASAKPAVGEILGGSMQPPEV